MTTLRWDVHLHIHVPELTHLGAQLMATFAELNQHVTDVQDAVHNINIGLQAVRTEIQALKDQLATGGLVTQAQLDSLDATLAATQAEATEVLGQETTL
jgi:hypothetical protein